MLYRFEDFELDADQLELRRGGEPVQVEPQVFSLLELLVSNHHRLVPKEEINDRVWAGRVVSEAALSTRMRAARQALGDDGRQQRLIRTSRDRGFRFVGDVEVVGTRPASPLRDETGLEDAPAPTEPGSIAVLPLQRLGLERRFEPLADAIPHEVIAALSRSRWLHVISRGSSFRFREADIDAREVGRLLGVRYLLTGSLAIIGRRSVVSVELVETQDGRVAWADGFEQGVDELLDVWRDITLQVATRIEGRIESEEASRALQAATEDLDASAAYFRGLWHMYRFNKHDNAVAAALFERALELDPRFGRAHAGLSFTHFQNAFIGYTADTAEQHHLAAHHAEQAYHIDALDPFAVLSMGRSEMLRGRWEEAVPWFDRSTEINPNYAWAFYHRALSAAIVDAGTTGPEHAMKALSLSPVDPLQYAMLTSRGLSHAARGEHDTAYAWAERGAQAPGAHVLISAIAATTALLAERGEDAKRWADDVRDRDPGFHAGRFHRAFPMRSEPTRRQFSRALETLGF